MSGADLAVIVLSKDLGYSGRISWPRHHNGQDLAILPTLLLNVFEYLKKGFALSKCPGRPNLTDARVDQQYDKLPCPMRRRG